MSDIAKRLRMAMTVTEMERITREAADEIERLLAALKEMIDAFEDEEMDYEVKEAAMKKARAAIVNQQKAVEK